METGYPILEQGTKGKKYLQTTTQDETWKLSLTYKKEKLDSKGIAASKEYK